MLKSVVAHSTGIQSEEKMLHAEISECLRFYLKRRYLADVIHLGRLLQCTVCRNERYCCFIAYFIRTYHITKERAEDAVPGGG